MHPPCSPARVAAQQAVQSRLTSGARILAPRPAPMVVGPALERGPVRSDFSTSKSKTAAFSCDASRARMHRGSHSSRKKKPNKNPQKTALHRPNHLRVISKQSNTWNKNDLGVFRCRINLFPAQMRASADSWDGSCSPQENDRPRSTK